MADEDPLDEKVHSQMPANLAAAAAANLAAQDAATAKFNAVAATLPTPGVAAPYSSPVTDLANLNVADAMSRADQLNGAQPSGGFQPRTPTTDVLRATRNYSDMVNNAIENRRAVLADAIANNTDPDNPALYVNDRPGPHGEPSRKQQLLHEFATVNQAAHDAALERASSTHEQFVQDQNIKSADDLTGLTHDLASIPFDVGTPEHEKAVLGVVASHPYGANTVAGRELLQTHAGIHDAASRLSPEDKSYWDSFKQAQKDTSEFARAAGVDVQYDDQGFPSIEATRAHAEDAGVFQPRPQKPNATYVKQVQALAEAQSKKDAAYNRNKKADLTSYDNAINTEQAKLDAVREALGMNEPPSSPNAAPVQTQSPDITQDGYNKLKTGETYFFGGKQYTKK